MNIKKKRFFNPLQLYSLIIAKQSVITILARGDQLVPNPMNKIRDCPLAHRNKQAKTLRAKARMKTQIKSQVNNLLRTVKF